PFTAPTPVVDVIATLTAAGKFSTLLKAVDAAGLTATLKQPANFTVFAPTDAAFAALPAGALDDLLKPENRAKLQHVILYHLINAPVTTAATAGHAAADIASVAGPTLHVDG
ncbi:fasciclin domain-containing protein, partial [Mycobacterium tuberculosis]